MGLLLGRSVVVIQPSLIGLFCSFLLGLPPPAEWSRLVLVGKIGGDAGWGFCCLSWGEGVIQRGS